MVGDPKSSPSGAPRSAAPQPQAPSGADWLKDVWPSERDILLRPERLRYIRRITKNENCVFCAAAEGPPSFESLVVTKSKLSMVVMNKFPYNPGHILVIPQRHEGDLLKLTHEEYADLHELLRKAYVGIEKAFEPAGLNIGMNLGAVAGAGIPDHLHYHLVPRWRGDLNFFPLIAETKVIPMSLEDSYQKLFEVLQ